jgi:tRNA(fMet)-specific endonuclease VapC
VTHLLDTDTMSIWQNGTGPDYAIFALRMSAYLSTDIVTSIVSFHEQIMGAHAYLNRPKTTTALVSGYERLERIRNWYTQVNVLPFDDLAETTYDNLRASSLRIGTMDLRIAAIALSRDLTVVTRNIADFGRVPQLRIEDWTR